jgi:DDE superfamily endonuclease
VGGIAPGALAAIGGRLEAFADDIFESLPRTDQRARGECYLRGLMLEGRRKSVEPMAARLGGEVDYQALHHFVAVSPWDWRPVRRRLAERLVGALSPTAWAADDTGVPKDGSCLVGVQRQYCGTLGKTANCQLGVSVNAVTEAASCPLDWRLFVPESWDEDAMAERRVACHLPEGVHHRPKWQLVLDMLDELHQWGCARRCWSVTPATARSASSARDWMIARSPLWCRSRPTPAPIASRCGRLRRHMPGGVAARGPVTASGPARSGSSPWPQASPPAWT